MSAPRSHSIKLASENEKPPRGFFDNNFSFSYTDNLEAKQVLGIASFRDWYLANRGLPSASNNQNLRGVSLRWYRKPKSTASELRKWTQLTDLGFFDKRRLIINSMPPFHGLADWLAFPITIPNYIFGRIANVVGFLIKGLGDGLAGVGRFLLPAISQGLRDTGRKAISGGVGNFILQGMLLLAQLLLAAVVGSFAISFWVIAQPLFLLSNTINYVRNLFDGITNLVVRFVAIFTHLVGDTATYADPWYSLSVVLINAAKLAPIALLIAFSIVPIAGPLGAFLGTVVVNSVMSAGLVGASSLGVLFGLLMSWQAYAAVVTAIDTFFQRGIFGLFAKSYTRAERAEISQRYEGAISDHAAAVAKHKFQLEYCGNDISENRRDIQVAKHKLAQACTQSKRAGFESRWLLNDGEFHCRIQRKAEIEMQLSVMDSLNAIHVSSEIKERLKGELKSIEIAIRSKRAAAIEKEIDERMWNLVGKRPATNFNHSNGEEQTPLINTQDLIQQQRETRAHLGEKIATYEFMSQFYKGSLAERLAADQVEQVKKRLGDLAYQLNSRESLDITLAQAIQELARAEAWHRQLQVLERNDAALIQKIGNARYQLMLEFAQEVEAAANQKYREIKQTQGQQQPPAAAAVSATSTWQRAPAASGSGVSGSPLILFPAPSVVTDAAERRRLVARLGTESATVGFGSLYYNGTDFMWNALVACRKLQPKLGLMTEVPTDALEKAIYDQAYAQTYLALMQDTSHRSKIDAYTPSNKGFYATELASAEQRLRDAAEALAQVQPPMSRAFSAS